MKSIWTGVLRPFFTWLVVCWLVGIFLASAFGFSWGTQEFGAVMSLSTIPAAIAGCVLGGNYS